TLIVSGFVSFTVHAPWSHRVVTFTDALTTTERMVDRVHRLATNDGSPSTPARTACFTPADVFVVCVSNLADGSAADRQDLANFTGRQFHLAVIAHASNQCRLSSGTAADLSTFSGSQFNIVNDRALRNLSEGQIVSGFNVDVVAGFNLIAHLQ